MTEQNTDKNLWYMIGGIVIIVVALVATGFFLPERQADNIVAYNTFVFEKKADDFWYTQVQQADLVYEVPLRYNPYEVDDVIITGSLKDIFGGEDIFITFDPDSEKFSHIALGAAELSLSLGSVFNKLPRAACTFDDGTDTCEGLEEVTCDDTDKSVVYLQDVNVPVPLVILKGNCATVQGNGIDLLKGVDRLLYLWLNVMPQ